jgi:hypothetical protein
MRVAAVALVLVIVVYQHMYSQLPTNKSYYNKLHVCYTVIYYALPVLVSATNVIDAANVSLVQYAVKCSGNVLYIQEVSSVVAVAVHSQRPPAHQLIDELRYHLLWVLVRPIDIVATCNDDWQFEAPVVGLSNELSPCLSGCVRVSRL